MKQSDRTNYKPRFEQLRKNYPEKLKQLAMKAQLMVSWIKQAHLSEFLQIYQKNQQKLKKNKTSNQKVLDSSENVQAGFSYDQNILNYWISESVKIIVQAYQKKIEISEKYHLQNAEQMVTKAKLTIQQLLRENKKQPVNRKDQGIKQKTTPMGVKSQKKQVGVKRQQIQYQTKLQQKATKIKQPQTSINQAQKLIIEPVKNKQKHKSLFVQKQAPITQQNIFKAQNNFNLASSQLQQGLHLANHIPPNPASHKPNSSTKSNRSKKSNLSSREQNSLYQADQCKKDQKKSNPQPEQESRQAQSQNPRRNSQQNNEQFDLQHEEQDHSSHQQDPVREKPQMARLNISRVQFAQDCLHLPSPFAVRQGPAKRKSQVQAILTNPFIKRTFNHLCKQSYIGGAALTFDQISQSAQDMSLNKWMVFCKEFAFVDRIKKKALVDIFQQCADMKSTMNQKQFLDALIVLQGKLKVDQADFISKNMCLGSEMAFRQKVGSFKINYTSQRHDFFEQAALKPVDRYYKRLPEQKYQKQKQKQKQFILHQGKFKQQIQSQISQRKNIRQLKKLSVNSYAQKKANKIGNFHNASLSRQSNPQNNSANSPYLRFKQKQSNPNANNNQSSIKDQTELELSKMNMSRRVDPLSYSYIFNNKNNKSVLSTSTSKNNPHQSSENRKFIEQKQKTNYKQLQAKSKAPEGRSKALEGRSKHPAAKDETKQTRQARQTRQNPHKFPPSQNPCRQWTYPVHPAQFSQSQSQESDDILRQHLTNERNKQRNLPQRLPLSRIAEEYKRNQKWLNIHQDQQSDRETQVQNERQG